MAYIRTGPKPATLFLIFNTYVLHLAIPRRNSTTWVTYNYTANSTMADGLLLCVFTQRMDHHLYCVYTFGTFLSLSATFLILLVVLPADLGERLS